MKKARILALLLAFLMCAGIFAACKDNESTDLPDSETGDKSEDKEINGGNSNEKVQTEKNAFEIASLIVSKYEIADIFYFIHEDTEGIPQDIIYDPMDFERFGYYFATFEQTEIQDYYDKIEDVCIFTSVTAYAHEFGIFKFENAKDAKEFSDLINNRVNAIMTIQKDYDVDSYQRALNSVINQKGEYIWYIVLDGAEQIDSYITSEILK